MPYESVDILQRALTQDVFHYAKDAKKAAGRALGTLVEIIAFYLLKSWGYERSTAIERRLPEYANPDITHNVEFSLHPSAEIGRVRFDEGELPLTPVKIHNRLPDMAWPRKKLKSTQLLSSEKILRNACTLYEDKDGSRIMVAYLDASRQPVYQVSVNQLASHPFAVMECKRVGVEEGTRKGPQTIEKAKQGAYVARVLSSLQKVRTADGRIYGILHLEGENLRYEPYKVLLQNIIESDDASLLKHFILTVGIVSNHGNWFTTSDQNKELKVLAQSYDWLLFLADEGISKFADDLLIAPPSRYRAVRDSFVNSYGGERGENIFTKVKIALNADLAIQEYFSKNLKDIERWFNVVSPTEGSVRELKNELGILASKNWAEMLR